MRKTIVLAVAAAPARLLIYTASPPDSKLMQVFFNMDRMIGKDFEDGLRNLKALAEGR